MIKSMTGFGRAQEVLNEREITVEVKSVNSRYFEYSSRLPRSLAFADDPLKKAVGAVTARGKTELYLSVQTLGQAEMEISANLAVARGYRDALKDISNSLDLDDDIKTSSLVRFNDIFNLRRGETDEDALLKDILQTANTALTRYDEMRAIEGGKLEKDILSRIDIFEEMVAVVEKDSAGRVARYTEKLSERLKEVLADTNIDESRMLTEAAIFADKTAVDEETVRLRSHLAQFREIVANGGQVGRKLDFLVQEINRETNTIGSKCQEVDITRCVVDMKAEIEKIREQIQNLE